MLGIVVGAAAASLDIAPEAIEYHPVVVYDPNERTDSALQGLFSCFDVDNFHTITGDWPTLINVAWELQCLVKLWTGLLLPTHRQSVKRLMAVLLYIIKWQGQCNSLKHTCASSCFQVEWSASRWNSYGMSQCCSETVAFCLNNSYPVPGCRFEVLHSSQKEIVERCRIPTLPAIWVQWSWHSWIEPEALYFGCTFLSLDVLQLEIWCPCQLMSFHKLITTLHDKFRIETTKTKLKTTNPCLVLRFVRILDCAAFDGQPVALADGRLIDSASLPRDSIRGHAVNITAESLMQSLQSTRTVNTSDLQAIGDEIQAAQEDQGQQQTVHPVIISNMDASSHEILRGKLDFVYLI